MNKRYSDDPDPWFKDGGKESNWLEGKEEKPTGEVIKHSVTYNLKNEPMRSDDSSSVKSDELDQ